MSLWIALALMVPAAPPVQDPTDSDIEDLIDQLASDYLDEREEAKKKLIQIGERVIPFVSKAIDKADSRVVLSAIDILRELKDTKHVEKVGKMFEEAADEETLIKSFDYLKAAGKAAEDYLIKALKRRGDYFRKGALEKLKEIQSKKAAPDAYAMYKSEEDPQIRRMAFDLIKELRLEAKDLLVNFLTPEEQDESIRRESIQYLEGAFEDTKVIGIIVALLKKELQDSVVNQGFQFFGGCRKELIEDPLIELLGTTTPLTRRLAIRRLAEIKSAKALDKVLEAAKTIQDREVKMECIKYFATFPEKTEDYLLKLLDDPDAGIRRKVIQDLKSSRSKVAFEKIREILEKDADVATRQEAFGYFFAIGAEAQEILIKGLEDSDETIRSNAVDAIGEYKLEAGIMPLVKSLQKETDKGKKDRLINALGKIGLNALSAIERAAKDDASFAPVLEVVRNVYDEALVEAALGGCITVNESTMEENTGTFDGQFASLKKLPIDATRVAAALQRIQEEGYQPRTARIQGMSNQDLIRRTAVLGMAEVGGDAAIQFLRKRFEELSKLEYHEAMIEDVAVSLARLGVRDPCTGLMNKLSEEATKLEKDDPNSSFEKLFSLNVMRHRIGDRDAALKGYQALDEAMAKSKDRDASVHASVLYNLACSLAFKGKKAEAVETLKRAVQTGFRDKAWIEKDEELNSIRGEAGYKELIADSSLFRGQ